MKPIKLKYVIEDLDRHGNVRVYVRVPGCKKVRIRERPGTQEFLTAYQMAIEGSHPKSGDKRATVSRRQPGSFAWLMEQYYRCAEYKQLDQRTQHVRRLILDKLCESHGNKPYKMMEARHVRKIRDEAAETPEAANGKVKALRQVFKWAIEASLAESNPARDVPYLRGNPDGFHTWTVEEVEQFKERHPLGTKARLALALLLYTGVRRSDVVKLGRQMEKDGWLHFTETKGAKRQPKKRDVPILPELREAIDAMPAGHLTYIVTEFGKPFSAAGFGNWFRDRCDEAGLPQCSAHGLRKAGATIAANNGATEHQLMAMYGWDSPKQAALYTKRANRKKLAGDAMHLISAGHDANKTVPPKPTDDEKWDKSAEK